MRILVVEPRKHDPRYDLRSLTPAAGAVVVGTLLARAGHEVQVVSEYVERFDPAEAHAADLVGISITTYNARRGYEIAAAVRAPVVFGGFHASLLPEEALGHGSYVVRGDGHPVVELATRLAAGEARSLEGVPNLVFRSNGAVVHNRSEARIPDVVPDYGLVRGYHRLGLNRLLRIPLVAAGSRGCPGRCAFCAVAEIYPEVRRKRRETLLADIHAQVRASHPLGRLLPRFLWITDDNFFADRAWAKETLRDLARMDTGFQLVLQARPEIGRDEELLGLMAEARISRVYLGIECLDQEGLDEFAKGQSVELCVSTVRKLQRLGIEVHGLFVFGGESFRRGDGRRVAAFVRELGLSGLLVQPLTPFPGTRLHRALKAQGRLLTEDWSDYDGKVVFRPRNMTPAQLQREIDDAYGEAYSLPRLARYLLRGRRGSRLQLLGEGLFRRAERRKMQRYVRERLSA